MYSTVAKPWLKVRAASTRCEQRLRHRLAGAVMQREAAQHLAAAPASARRAATGSSTKSVGTRGAGEERVGDVGQQPVQRVAELVEQRARVVEGEQRRLALAALAKFITLTMIGLMSPASFSWLRKALIQAPLRFEGRAK